MQDSLRNNGALSGTKFDRAAFEVNQQLPLDHVEKFVIVIMLVPMIFAQHDTKTDHGAVHLAEGLVVPLVGARIGERLFVHNFQRLMKNVESRFVGKALHVRHEGSPVVQFSLIITGTRQDQRAKLSSHALGHWKKSYSAF